MAISLARIDQPVAREQIDQHTEDVAVAISRGSLAKIRGGLAPHSRASAVAPSAGLRRGAHREEQDVLFALVEGQYAPKPPHLPAQASRQRVWVELELLAQLPALAEQLLHPGHPSPRLLRLLVLPRPQREELTRLFHTLNQHEGLGPRCVIQRPLDEGGPPLDELLLAARLHRPLARAVGLTRLLHTLSSFCSPRTGAGFKPADSGRLAWNYYCLHPQCWVSLVLSTGPRAGRGCRRLAGRGILSQAGAPPRRCRSVNRAAACSLGRPKRPSLV